MMKNIRPIYFIHGEKIKSFQARAVIGGIREALAVAEVDHLIRIREFGAWRTQQWKIKGTLTPHQSVDWYVAQGRIHSARTNQVNARAIVDSFVGEPWQKTKAHYDVVLISDDMYEDGVDFIVGRAKQDVGVVLSVARLLGLDSVTQYECLKTLAMHEISHVFGLPPRDRTVAIDARLGRHCANLCVMRQGLVFPKDLIQMSDDRADFGAFCSLCHVALKQFFA